MNEKENLTQKYIYTAFLQLLEKNTDDIKDPIQQIKDPKV